MFKNKTVIVSTVTGGTFYGKLIKHSSKTNTATIKNARRIVLIDESLKFVTPMVKRITVEYIIDCREPTKEIKKILDNYDNIFISDLLDCEVI